MSRDFTFELAPGDSMATTCRRCGARHEHPNHSVIEAWRASHKCPDQAPPKEAA